MPSYYLNSFERGEGMGYETQVNVIPGKHYYLL